MNKLRKNNKGFALLLSIIISSIAMSIGLSMLQITMKQLTLGTTTKGSEVAFQAANAGLECARYLRNSKSVDFNAGDTVPLDCLATGSLDFEVNTTGNGTVHYYDAEFEWDTGSEDLCVSLEIVVVNDTGGNRDQNVLGRGIQTCVEGDICTYIISQGYNRSCAELSSSIFTAQRELTLGF